MLCSVLSCSNTRPWIRDTGKLFQRLSQAPVLMDQAKVNLTDSPEVWTRVAREENDGNIDLIDKTLRAKAPANLKAEF